MVGRMWQTNEQGTESMFKSSHTSSIQQTPKLCDVLSVMAKSIFSTRSFSENLHPVAAESILKVMSSNSLRVARDSENILNVGNTRCFPSIENDWTI